VSEILDTIKESTFIVLPIRPLSGQDSPESMIYPEGTGFFISGNGLFLTANHVVKGITDFSNIRLQGIRWDMDEPYIPKILSHIKVVRRWIEFDLALLSIDFEKNKKEGKDFLIPLSEFPHLDVTYLEQDENTPIYLAGQRPTDVHLYKSEGILVQTQKINPRIVSSCIISRDAYIGSAQKSEKPKYYAIDTLAYKGNSGSPVVVQSNGKVCAVVTNSQLEGIHYSKKNGNLSKEYCLASSIKNIENRY